VDQSRLAAADAAYERGDWTTAAREYLAATEGQSAGSGYAFHRAGNSLMKLKRVDDACAVYERALQDPEYADSATVACNLGTANAALGAFDKAAAAFRTVLADSSYGSRYRALQGLGGALYEMGRIDEAAEAYKGAAMDSANPDPGRALNNLGLCFMSLGRPEEAVEAYSAALAVPGYRGAGKAAANLGMAFAALGMHESAVASFERARDKFGHELSGSMDAAYRASLGSCAAPGRVEGWSTGEMPPVISTVPGGDEDDESQFFTITDAEMKSADREARKRERRVGKEARPAWVTALTWGGIVIAVAGALVAGYLFGLGYPTQHMTVQGMLESYRAGEEVQTYWVAVPSRDVEKAMSSLPTTWASYEITRVTRSARTSKADVTVVLEQGGTVAYEVALAREGVGWKVSGVSNSFSSMDGGL
jgi:Tfp pilus assembly protein PilF